MTKRKRFEHPQPPMMHSEKFEKYLGKRKPSITCSNRKNTSGTHCGFKLVNQLPLYRIDNLENIEI